VAEVTELRPADPDEDVIVKLRELLEAAEAGRVRGLLFVALGQGNGNTHHFGHVGETEFAEFAMGIKLLDRQLSRLIEEFSEDPEEWTDG